MSRGGHVSREMRYQEGRHQEGGMKKEKGAAATPFCTMKPEQLPLPVNYLPVTLRQLETDPSCECFRSKCLVILKDLRTGVKLLIGNGKGGAQE